LSKSFVAIGLDKVSKENTIVENEAAGVIGGNSDGDELKCPPEYTQAKADHQERSSHCISHLNTAIESG